MSLQLHLHAAAAVADSAIGSGCRCPYQEASAMDQTSMAGQRRAPEAFSLAQAVP